MSTGRYRVKLPNGRVFTVEPIRERDQRVNDVVFRNGGISGDEMKHKATVQGGAVPEAESVITLENGFKNIQVVQNPMDVIEQAMRQDGLL